VGEDSEILVDLLEQVLGKHRAHYDRKSQITFDCPVCSYDIKGLDHGDGKGNLEINYDKHVYKCWSCSESNGTHGPLYRLFEKYGNKKILKMYDLLKPEDERKEVKKTILRMPPGYTKFKDAHPRYLPAIEAKRYLTQRGVTDEMIDKYDIGFTTEDPFAYRIIIPSYDSEGKLNYFVARAWVKKKMKYKNPSVPKEEIIFNESRINWEEDIYLCEGAFDGIFLPNPLVMLGKKLSPLMLEKLYNQAKKDIIICLDGDAWADAKKLFHELNGGILYNRIKALHLPTDKDACDLKGDVLQYLEDIGK
jgi:DNA primase